MLYGCTRSGSPHNVVHFLVMDILRLLRLLIYLPPLCSIDPPAGYVVSHGYSRIFFRLFQNYSLLFTSLCSQIIPGIISSGLYYVVDFTSGHRYLKKHWTTNCPSQLPPHNCRLGLTTATSQLPCRLTTAVPPHNCRLTMDTETREDVVVSHTQGKNRLLLL